MLPLNCLLFRIAFMPPSSHTDTSPSNGFEDLTSPEVFSLESIIQTAAKLENMLKDSLFHRQTPPPQLPPLITMSLPAPCSITSKLIETGLDNDSIDRISTAFIRTAYELRESQETTLRQGCAELAKVPHNSVSDIMDLQKRLCQTVTNNYLQQLDRWTTDLLQRVLESVRREQTTANHNSVFRGPRSRRAFNHVSLNFSLICLSEPLSSVMFHFLSITLQKTHFQHTPTRISLPRSVT